MDALILYGHLSQARTANTRVMEPRLKRRQSDLRSNNRVFDSVHWQLRKMFEHLSKKGSPDK